MKWPRVSIVSMAFAVLLVAANLGALRRWSIGHNGYSYWGPWHIYEAISILPAMNVLTVGLYRMTLDRDRRGPSAVGFQLAGWSAVFAFAAILAVNKPAISDRFDLFVSFFDSGFDLVYGIPGRCKELRDSIDSFLLKLVTGWAYLSGTTLLAGFLGGQFAHMAWRRTRPSGTRETNQIATQPVVPTSDRLKSAVSPAG